MPDYRRTHSCTGEEDTDLRLEDGKCGYSEKTCCLSAEAIGGDSSSSDGGSRVGIGAILSGYASSFVDGCLSSESGAYSECTASSNQSWVSNLTVSASGLANSGVVVANVSANTSTSSRTATITVRNACGKTATFTYTQSGAKNYVFLIGPSYGSITNTSETDSILQIGQSHAMLIESTLNGSFCEASVTSNTASSWLEVSLQRAASSNYYTLSYNAPANNTYSTRSGVITVKQSGSNKTVTLSVSQEGVKAMCEIDGTVTYDASASGNLTFNNFRVVPGHTCGSSFSSTQVVFTIWNGTFTTSSSPYYTVSSDGKSATVTVNTAARAFSIPYRKTGTSDVHISGERSSGGSPGNCSNGCNLIYDISG